MQDGTGVHIDAYDGGEENDGQGVACKYSVVITVLTKPIKQGDVQAVTVFAGDLESAGHIEVGCVGGFGIVDDVEGIKGRLGQDITLDGVGFVG